MSCTEACCVYKKEKLLEKGEDTLEELTFANLRAIERSYVHKAAQEKLTNRALEPTKSMIHLGAQVIYMRAQAMAHLIWLRDWVTLWRKQDS